MTSWRARVHDRSLGNSANDLTPTVSGLFEDLLRGNEIDLSWVEVDKVNPLHLCVVLRATNGAPGWAHAFEVAKRALERDGIDPADAMYGLTL